MRGPLHRVVRDALPATVTTIVALALLLHFAVIWLYLAPMNPVKLRLARQVYGYVHPFFAQNWQLFAPNPVSHDELLLVKVRWADSTGRKWESAWMDVTTPVHRALQRQRLGPFSKLARPHNGALELTRHQDKLRAAERQRIVQEFMEARQHARARGVAALSDARAAALLDSLTELSPPEKRQRRLGRVMLYRLASASAARFVGPSGRVIAVNVRVAQREFPRFSERARANAPSTLAYTASFGWQRAQTVVATAR